MPLKETARYGTYYLDWYIALTIVLTIVSVVLARFSLESSSFGIAINLGAAGFTHYRFLKDKDRSATSKEYWTLVLLSTAIGFVLELLKLAAVLRLQGDALPGIGYWIGISVFVVLLAFVVNAMFYSRWMADAYLKRIRKRKLGDR